MNRPKDSLNTISNSYLIPFYPSNAHASAQGQVSWLATVSPEIRSLILSFQTNRDRKRLRLTCKVLSDVTPLRLSRVFLSANPLDIEGFHAIADHPQFRHQIKEIIWDDARFVSTPSLLDDYWCQTLILTLTLNPAFLAVVWNALLPYGFNYPIPRGWPTAAFGENSTIQIVWSRALEAYKEQWHGVRIALHILAQHEHNIPELRFDPFLLVTGINYSMLDRQSDEYNHFWAVMKRPGFGNLSLPLFVGGNGTHYWAQQSSGYLHRALREYFDASKSDILDLLKLLPRRLRSLESSLHYFQIRGDCLNELLKAIRTELHLSDETIKLSLDDEVNDFLYGSGENNLQGQDFKNLKFGVGTLRDLFEPEFRRPNLELEQLSELGIIQWP
ncbi:hypothetical protein F1880_002574 [Penicillium rolfsii]|nr:hypothetical protein F1880_002574 [Penicillium rolfsii]